MLAKGVILILSNTYTTNYYNINGKHEDIECLNLKISKSVIDINCETLVSSLNPRYFHL